MAVNQNRQKVHLIAMKMFCWSNELSKQWELLIKDLEMKGTVLITVLILYELFKGYLLDVSGLFINTPMHWRYNEWEIWTMYDAKWSEAECIYFKNNFE